MKAILAPVPCLHIFDALKTCAKHGTVAFGSQADFFLQDEHKKCRFPTGTKVLITATRPELGHSNFYKFGTANFRAAFVQWTKANDDGEHPSPQLRPLCSISDSVPIAVNSTPRSSEGKGHTFESCRVDIESKTAAAIGASRDRRCRAKGNGRLATPSVGRITPSNKGEGGTGLDAGAQ